MLFVCMFWLLLSCYANSVDDCIAFMFLYTARNVINCIGKLYCNISSDKNPHLITQKTSGK